MEFSLVASALIYGYSVGLYGLFAPFAKTTDTNCLHRNVFIQSSNIAVTEFEGIFQSGWPYRHCRIKNFSEALPEIDAIRHLNVVWNSIWKSIRRCYK